MNDELLACLIGGSAVLTICAAVTDCYIIALGAFSVMVAACLVVLNSK